MKVSIKWLKEFVDFSMAPEEMADVLTMAGNEVEEIERFEDDDVLDIGVTPNRPDCLSIRGIAREISVILKSPFMDKSALIHEEEGVRPLIDIKDPDLCARYSSRIIRGVEVKPSPEWISKRLEHHGLRPVNNIVDITNYVLLEMGHPLHAFDLNKLEGKRIVVDKAGSADTFQTLDGDKRELKSGMLLIFDEKKPVAIAGVMGGLDTEVTESTTDVLLESAYFDPLSIRKTSRALNLSTESSYRFERGADIKITVPALNRAAKLITEVAGGKGTKTTDVYKKTFISRTVSVSMMKINDTLGTTLEPLLIKDMLTRLGMENKMDEGTINVIPPSFRHDIQRDTDVIEEVARLYGYDRIPVTLPSVTMNPANENPVWGFKKTLRELMRKSGYSEAINYSFLNPEALDRLRIPSEDPRRNLLKIRNPLRKEEETLRTTLVPALLDNVRMNINRGVSSLRIFEVSRVFFNTGQKQPEEILKMAAVYVKDERSFVWEEIHDGFYDIKGVFENLLLGLGIKKYVFTRDTDRKEPYLHPGKSCVVRVGDKEVGVLGALHPEASRGFDITPETYIMELDIDDVYSSVPSEIKFLPLPKYPSVQRDLAVVISEDVP
jgi:phenylalanyl-tRNA synthetase beta chain